MRTYLTAFLLIVTIIAPATAHSAADEELDIMIGQMLMVGFRGYSASEDAPVIRDITQYHVGGVILFDKDMSRWYNRKRNIRSPKQVASLTESLQSAADIPLFIAVDQEGGNVQRLKAKYGFPPTPSAQTLGKQDDAAVHKAARSIASTLDAAGFNMNFSPVADVNVNPNSPAIGKIGRSFSSDPSRVTRCNAIFLEAFAQQGIVGSLKHFPGHGSAGADSHYGVTDVTNTWSESELIPYRTLIGNGSVQMIMTAHIFNGKLDPIYPATLSKAIITGLLRERLGFNGVVITDDMDMRAITDAFGRAKAIQLAIEAGADILLFGNNITFDEDVAPKAHGIIKELVETGVISRKRISRSYDRIMRLKNTLKQ